MCLRLYNLISIFSQAHHLLQNVATKGPQRMTREMYAFSMVLQGLRRSLSEISPASRNLPSSVSKRGKYPPFDAKFST